MSVDMPLAARRIWVKGGSGSGKTTLARALAQRLGLEHVELDALHHDPGWTPAPAPVLQARVSSALDDARGWVVDGNYDGKLGALVRDRAELVVWLDGGVAGPGQRALLTKQAHFLVSTTWLAPGVLTCSVQA
jgi:dephospho-CoA kinase